MKFFFFLLTLSLTTLTYAKDIPAGFKQEKVTVDGVGFNVYKGGTGEALVLLHGYAQSSLMWSKAMDQFKDRFTVIVPDLRGAGKSDAPEAGYDKLTMAKDIKGILEHYGITKAQVVGHDIGLMVAYTLAAKYPEMVEKLVLMDAFVPGVGPGEKIYNDPNIWHFRFHGPYAEKLVKDRERIYFDALWDGFSVNPKTFPEKDKKQYISEYQSPGHMKAGFAWFENFPQDSINNKDLSKTKLKMPVLAMGGEKANGQAVVDTVKVAAKTYQASIIKNCGHWMMEECPRETLGALEGFLSNTSNLKQAQEVDK